jgi:hypothetical protein
VAYPDPKIVTVAAPTNPVNTTRPPACRSARSTAPTRRYVVILSGAQHCSSERGVTAVTDEDAPDSCAQQFRDRKILMRASEKHHRPAVRQRQLTLGGLTVEDYNGLRPQRRELLDTCAARDNGDVGGRREAI